MGARSLFACLEIQTSLGIDDTRVEVGRVLSSVFCRLAEGGEVLLEHDGCVTTDQGVFKDVP